MKFLNKLSVFLVLFFCSFSLNAQTYLKPDENNLKLGGLPESPNLHSITKSKAALVLEKIKAEKIEYRYINGSCEDRAHFISLILKKEGVKSGKVWVFAPAKYTLMSDDLFNIQDPYEINEKVEWGYHVAPILLIESDSFIVDLSFKEDDYIKKNEWLSKLNSKQSIYFYSKIDSYLFNTLGGLKIWNNNLDPAPSYVVPDFVPNIITGDFWALTPENDYVYRGLAINDLAIKIHNKIKTDIDKEYQKYLKSLLENIDLIEKEIVDKPSNDSLADNLFSVLKKYYSERYVHWKNRYDFYNN